MSNRRLRNVLRYNGVAKPAPRRIPLYDESCWRNAAQYKRDLWTQVQRLARPSRPHELVIASPISVKATIVVGDTKETLRAGEDVLEATSTVRVQDRVDKAPTGTIDDAEENDSLASVSLGDPAAAQDEVLTVLADLVLHERTRRRCNFEIAPAEARLRSLEEVRYRQEMIIKQLSENLGDNEGLINKYREVVRISKGKCEQVAASLARLESQLADANRQQLSLEPRLYQVARSFLSNALMSEDEETIADRDFQYQLASVADLGRERLRRQRRDKRAAEETPSRTLARGPTTSKIDRIRDQRHRTLMCAFYQKFAGPILVRRRLLPAADGIGISKELKVNGAEVAQQNELSPHNVKLLKVLSAARSELEKCQNTLNESRSNYSRELEKALITRRSITQEEFAREWLLTTLARANEATGAAEAKVETATKQAKAAGLLKRAGQEPSHPEDGHTSSAGTLFGEQMAIGAAQDYRSIEQWRAVIAAEKERRLEAISRGVSLTAPRAIPPQDIQLPPWSKELRPIDSYSNLFKPAQLRQEIDDWQTQMSATYEVSRRERLAKLSSIGWPVMDP